MTDEMADRGVPQQTYENIAYHIVILEFQAQWLEAMVDANTGLLDEKVDWGKLLDEFNQQNSGKTTEFWGQTLKVPAIGLDQVINGLRRYRFPPEKVEKANRWADQLEAWQKVNQDKV